MTWVHPGFAVAGLFAALAVVALHFIMHRLPPPSRFPTARFIPPGTARAVRRAMRPDDLLLLALRAAMLLLLGAALARPVLTPERRPVARVVALDRSRAVASIGAARDSAASLVREGDILVAWDSIGAIVASESIATIERSTARGSLSAALVAAAHAASGLRQDTDSIELIVVTPAVREEVDDATEAIRAAWPGRIRVVRVEAETLATAMEPSRGITAPPDDPVAAAVALWNWSGASQRVRVVRGELSADDSTWARSGGVLVHWPLTAASDPAGDSIGAVIAPGAVVVAAFARAGAADERADESRGSPVAWWSDGRTAAVQTASGAGCIREVDIDVPRRGDVALRSGFQSLLRALTAPCDGWSDRRPIVPEGLARLSGDGPLALASSLPHPSTRAPLAPWLLGAALALALLEPLARRRRTDE